MSKFFDYVDGVISGKIVVGKYTTLAVERFLNDYDKKDYVFDVDAGHKMVNFAEKYCYHWKGPKMGTPVVLEPHQHFYWMQKYGWKNPDTGLQRFRRSSKLIARKQYKTTEIAIESLNHMVTGIDQPAQVFSCATKEADSVVVVNDAGRIAMTSPRLKSIFSTSIHEPYVRRVFVKSGPGKGSFMTFMTEGHDAVDISFGIGDECHDWPNASKKDRIESAMGNRISPMFSSISTSGFNKEGYCYSIMRDTGIKILEGVLVDDEQLIMFFEMDEGDDWKDQEMWVKSNPNIPYSSTHMPYLISQFKKALNEGSTTEVNFKTKNLNIWVDAPATFIPTEIWDMNMHRTEVDHLVGSECYGGLEIGPSGEISALALLFPGEVVRIKMLFFLAAEALKLNDVYRDNRELIKVDAGNEVENDVAVSWIVEEFQKYNMHSFCFPVTHKNNSIVQDLIKTGYTGNPISQGLNGISNATEEWEKLLRAGQIEHFGNPILRWMNSNCLAVRKEAGTRIEKNPKVLGIYACLNALAQWKTINAEGGNATVEIW